MPLSEPASHVLNIPSGVAFLDCLAERLIDGTLLAGPPDAPLAPGALAEATILLPNRRAARELTDRLVTLAGGAVILPRIAAIGDIDEDAALIGEFAAASAGAEFGFEAVAARQLPLPPAVSALERHLALTRLVYAFGRQKAAAMSLPGRNEGLLIPTGAADASALALDLARLLDSLETEEIDAGALARLVPENHAAYWNISHEFLKIVVEAWPAHLAERGLSDPVKRRSEMIRFEARRLAAEKPDAAFIIAGSTGSVPATAALMKSVMGLPRGLVLLPGLDRDIDARSWDAIAAGAQTHPQFGLARLLGSLGVAREDIADLEACETNGAGAGAPW